MIRNLMCACAVMLLISCASVKQNNPPPEIVISEPVNLVFAEIPEAILDCPGLRDILLPAPDVDGRYAIHDVDRVILELYQIGADCGVNMDAVVETYHKAKEKYEAINGG